MSEEKFFWATFIGFAALQTYLFWLMGVFEDITTTGGLAILAILYVLVGLLLRRWVKDGMRF